MNDIERKARQQYISTQAAMALHIARYWFAEVEPNETTYEEIRVWVLARLAERGIGPDEIALVVTLEHETRRARFDFKLQGEVALAPEAKA